MNATTAISAIVSLVLGILIGWGASSVDGPSKGSLEQENADLKRKNKLLEQQIEEVNAKFLNNVSNMRGHG
ncbi:MAG: hypothetical protein MPJ50_12755 [Pirellulales bacterium]|nr:hypothetical protein [Pirellulales bacterium]